MTIREFWHDMRERLAEDHGPRATWGRQHGWRPGESREREEWQHRRIARDEDAVHDFDVYGTQDLGQREFESFDLDNGPVSREEDHYRGYDDYAFIVGSLHSGWPDRDYATAHFVSYRGRGPLNWRRADGRIHEEVCELLTEDDELDASGIEVTVKDAEVTLSGTVESRRDKRHAEDLAERAAGVHDVHNRLQVQRARDTFLGTRQALARTQRGC